MSGVPEWSQAEVDAVMRLYDERGRLPKWKPIADELARMNAAGDLNPALLHKSLVRSNNAVMNKVKEILYKELGDAPIRVRGGLLFSMHALPLLCCGPPHVRESCVTIPVPLHCTGRLFC